MHCKFSKFKGTYAFPFHIIIIKEHLQLFCRSCIHPWVIYIWNCIQKNAPKQLKTSPHIAEMDIMIILSSIELSKDSWFKLEIPWEMGLVGSLFGAGSSKMSFTKGNWLVRNLSSYIAIMPNDLFVCVFSYFIQLKTW